MGGSPNLCCTQSLVSRVNITDLACPTEPWGWGGAKPGLSLLLTYLGAKQVSVNIVHNIAVSNRHLCAGSKRCHWHGWPPKGEAEQSPLKLYALPFPA